MAARFQQLANLPELRRKISFSLLMLAVYRVGVKIPTPGINGEALADYFKKSSGTIFDMFNMFSGGALENFSLFALGIMPYISSSIIFQLLTVVIPQLEVLSKEGEAGRRKITQYTRYGTVVLGLIQALMISKGLEGISAPGSGELVVNAPGWGFRLMTMVTLTSGTAFIMWLGEQMSERGIGNGISLIIFAGIVARMPTAIINTVKMVSVGEFTALFLPILIAIMVFIIGVIIFCETAQRRIPVQYAKRVVGRMQYGGQRTHLPLKINMAGVIPPIFASSIMMFPATLSGFIQSDWIQKTTAFLQWGSLLHTFVYVFFVVFFCFFYTSVTFNPANVADNLKRNGGFIPGVRPGQKTAEYIDNVAVRLTVIGAIYISAICVLPTILIKYLNLQFYFGGTSLLIVIGVALDTLSQIESHAIMKNYEGFLKAEKNKSRYSG